ncbi:phage tail tape measure protein [Sanguibacter sp. HDW7]|uniref:phage tail tape measure protein n=1 Tax=Sanguibacter sp. HDW7 TaxID=2714931 RepID=UPI001409C959|nr:phage tail tape measure protein [Sanguibacter sp. HDW7]QIK83114.1 hypothetical protein G7063_05330 [Sanguibacter sp. HDW7]
MANVKDFVVNIIGEDNSSKAWNTFKANAGKAAAAAAAAFAGKEIGEAIQANIDAESITDKLSASLGATVEESKAWGEAASGVYRDAWGESMEDAAAGVESVIGNIKGMRTASSADIEAVTGKAMALADAMGVDVAESTTAAGILIKNGLANDATGAFDLITASLQKIPTSMRGEAIDAMTEYSTNFKNLGLSGDEALGLLAKTAGISSVALDKTGDSIKEFTIRATDGSKSSRMALASALGDDFWQDAENNLLAGGKTARKTFDDIVKGLLAMEDPSDQAATAIALFGTPIEDIGVDNIPAFLEALEGAEEGLGDTAGAAEKMASTLSGNPKSRVEEMRRGFEGWKQDLIGLPGPMGTVVAATTAFGGQAMQLATTVGLGIVALQNFSLAQTKATISTVASNVATGAAKVASGAATAAQWLWNAALTANPIGIVVVAIGALVGALVWFFTQTETGKKVIDAAWSGIKTAISSVTDWWKGTVMPMWNTTWSTLKGIFSTGSTGVRNILSGAWNLIKGIFKWTPVGLIIGHWDGIKGAFSRGGNAVRTVLNGAWNLIKGIFKWTPIGIITSNWDSIIGFFKKIPGRFTSALSTVQSAIGAPFKGAFNAVAGWWNGSVGKISFQVPDWVPGVGGKGWSIPKIPLLASGGVVTSATLAVVGEGSEPEAVLPLSKLDAMLNAPASSNGRAALVIENYYAGDASASALADELLWKVGRR